MVNYFPPVVAIIGRPNVGKSSLFNRLSQKRTAIVDKVPGVTRDRLYADVEYLNYYFRLIDTGGIDLKNKDKISVLVKEQAQEAVKEASYIFFMVEVTSGLTSLDEQIASLLRKTNKKVFLLVNKADNQELSQEASEFYRLGLGKPYCISSLHGSGITALLEDLTSNFLVSSSKNISKEPVKIAIVGQPNVGKSSFLNVLLNEERVIVSEEPGTTRDAIDTYLEKDGYSYIFIDTAGIKHKRKIKTLVDIFSMARAKQAIRRSDVVLILLDASLGITTDDTKIVEMVIKADKGLILIFNKWDLVKGVPHEEYKKAVYQRIKFASFCPMLFTSAKNGKNVLEAIELANTIYQNNSRYLHSEELSTFFKAALEKNPPPSGPFGQRPKIYSINQQGINPVTLVLRVNNKKMVKTSYLNFLSNVIRQKFDLSGAPVRFKLIEKG